VKLHYFDSDKITRY